MLASEQILLRLAQMVVQTTSCLICALLCALHAVFAVVDKMLQWLSCGICTGSPITIW